MKNVIKATNEMEGLKKFRFSRNKSKYIVVMSGKNKDNKVNQSIKEGVIEEIWTLKYNLVKEIKR